MKKCFVTVQDGEQFEIEYSSWNMSGPWLIFFGKAADAATYIFSSHTIASVEFSE